MNSRHKRKKEPLIIEFIMKQGSCKLYKQKNTNNKKHWTFVYFSFMKCEVVE